jgi:hypothetical protein
MKKIKREGSVVEAQPDYLKLRRFLVNLGNAYVRLSAPDRRKVMRLLERFAFGKASSVSDWDRWSKDDMQACYLKLQPISQKMANDMRRWASELLKTGHNKKLALKCLIDELDFRRWIEER